MAELEQQSQSQTPIAQEVQNSQNGLRALPSQVTSTTPATKPAKNPKRVAAGKLAAEKTKQAREAQKKAAVEAAAIIAIEKEKKSAAAKGALLRGSKSSQNVTPPVAEDPPESRFLTTNQWISLLGIGVAIVTTYVKREDIKAFINEKKSPTFKAPPTLITDDTPGGAILNAVAFIGGNYLAKYLGGGDDAALKEKERHDKALEAYQAAYAKYSRDRTKLLDWIQTNAEIKEQAKQNFTNTDYAFKLYNQAHPDKQMIPPKEPKFSDFYQPSEQQKQGELMFVGAGALALGYAAFRFL
ncbi:hypothetical protein ACROYT_G028512 [Oculina patagonica]